MKIAVGSLGSSLDAWVGGKFGYCPQFIIVDSETMEYTVVPMQQDLSEREASRIAIRIVAKNGAEVLLVENAMPACQQVLSTLGIEFVGGLSGLTVRQAVERFLSGALATPEGKRGIAQKVAVASLGERLDSLVGTEFGSVTRFVVVNPATMDYSVVPVEPPEEGRHLRLATIRSLVERGVTTVLTPAISPPCCQALWSLAVEVILIQAGGTVAEAIEKFRDGSVGQPEVLWPGEAVQ